jgi:basic membrane lipoprotein Med (substrate-binding protein (PBP1-ABC) superfamily)
VIGYVGAYPYAEVISGFTAFYLGAKEECPSATMKVRYTDSWSDYQKEYNLARLLISENCIIISQHSDTAGPAVACEEMRSDHLVYHVGYNQNMSEAAPKTSLISTRIDWTPYFKSAVGAVLDGETIEENLDCTVFGNDAAAGFDKGWVKMLPLNETIAASGTSEMIEESIAGFRKGTMHVFQGDYQGKDASDPTDTIDLNTEYIENEKQSAPAFHWILDGITIEGEE